MNDLPVPIPAPTAGIFQQAIDHPVGDVPSPGNFNQRYWVSTGYATGPESPVIFYFCGEAPCDAAYAESMGDIAKTLNAAIVVLEHRYYGASLPYPDLTLEHMKYLTIHNALEDAAAFEQYAKANLGLKGKWIAVGGSYPGMLAAFYRAKHPELVVGAWASSAPVLVQKSFTGYDLVASRALGTDCDLLFRQALGAAAAAFDNPATRDKVSTDLFGGPMDADKATFLQSISNVAMGAAQYGQQRALCSALSQHDDAPLDGLVGYLHPPLVSDDPPPPPQEVDAGDPDAAPPPAPRASLPFALAKGDPRSFMPAIRLPSATDSFAGSEWFYQVCTEVGFYQVKNPDRHQTVLSDLIDDGFFDRQCDQMVHRRPDVATTKATYYDPLLSGKVTNVLFVNGSDDPWSSLSFTDPSAMTQGNSAYVVQHGSHCEDLYNLTSTSLLGVFEVHKKFHDAAKQWLAQ
jgi:pimeloyl-ACP methyl ester carboxylesterase